MLLLQCYIPPRFTHSLDPIPMSKVLHGKGEVLSLVKDLLGAFIRLGQHNNGWQLLRGACPSLYKAPSSHPYAQASPLRLPCFQIFPSKWGPLTRFNWQCCSIISITCTCNFFLSWKDFYLDFTQTYCDLNRLVHQPSPHQKRGAMAVVFLTGKH